MPASKPSDDEVVIICMRVHGEDAEVVRGSRHDVCGECWSWIWVAPSTDGIVASCPGKVVTLLCTACAADRIEQRTAAGEEVVFQELTEEQRAEFERERAERGDDGTSDA